MSAPLRGVNLGGWLILEKWITPRLFDGTGAQDEYTFMQSAGAAGKLAAHRDSFITEADYAWLETHGIDAVRIPVGYWLLDGDPPYAEGLRYLDWAFAMAATYQLKVLLDIHGLPGSQNGNDHSGRIGPAEWQRNADARRRSLALVARFADRYKDEPALWGIEIINEPNAGAFQVPLRRYYSRAYRALAGILPAHVKIVYSDAWSPRIFALALFGRRRAVMDVHLYHMATLGAQKRPLTWYYRKLARRVRMLRWVSRFRPVIIGEWSGVISGETIGGLPAAEAERLEQAHFDIQAEKYADFAGTFYWTYKIEGSSGTNMWDYRSIIGNRTPKS